MERAATLIPLLILACVYSINANGFRIPNSSYPNPKYQFESCNRSSVSHICDPDGILTENEANKLDWLASEMAVSTPCLCPQPCRWLNSGVQIGIFLKYNVTTRNTNLSNSELGAIARQIRQQWHFGTCEDDIIIVLLAGTKQAQFDMGSAVERALTRRLARQIFTECSGHFENEYYYQGLESMVNSYRDVLRRMQPTDPKHATPAVSLAVGISLGFAVLVLMLVATALLKCRQLERNKSRQQGKSYLAPQNTETTAFQYHMCQANQKDVSSGSDDDDDESNVATFSDTFRRKLSDVAEENEGDVEAAAIKFAMTNVPKNSNTHITEL